MEELSNAGLKMSNECVGGSNKKILTCVFTPFLLYSLFTDTAMDRVFRQCPPKPWDVKMSSLLCCWSRFDAAAALCMPSKSLYKAILIVHTEHHHKSLSY